MAQPQLSFGRNVQVRVFGTTVENKILSATSPSSTSIDYANSYTQFSSVQPDGSPGFRIRGKITQVEATVNMGINPIAFSIYNLGADSRSLFQTQVGTKIQILAGYGTSPKSIATGNVLWSMTHKEGPDYITEVICGDSHFALVNGQVNLSFKGSVTYVQVISALMSSLEEVGIFAGNQQIPPGGYNNGIVLSGSPLDELKKICNKLNLSCNVVANQVNILPIGADTGAPIILLNENSGLIGIPNVRAPGVIGVINPTTPVSPQNNISFTCLLRPEIGLAQRVKIQSSFVNGEYVCGRVVHDFDSWSGPFFTEVEASIGM